MGTDMDRGNNRAQRRDTGLRSTALLVAWVVCGTILLLGSVLIRVVWEGSALLMGLFLLGLILVIASTAPEDRR